VLRARARVCVSANFRIFNVAYHTNSSTEVLLVLFNYKTHKYVKKVGFSAHTVIFVFTLTPTQLTMNTRPNRCVAVAILLLNIMYLPSRILFLTWIYYNFYLKRIICKIWYHSKVALEGSWIEFCSPISWRRFQCSFSSSYLSDVWIILYTIT